MLAILTNGHPRTTLISSLSFKMSSFLSYEVETKKNKKQRNCENSFNNDLFVLRAGFIIQAIYHNPKCIRNCFIRRVLKLESYLEVRFAPTIIPCSSVQFSTVRLYYERTLDLFRPPDVRSKILFFTNISYDKFGDLQTVTTPIDEMGQFCPMSFRRE